MLPKHKKKVLRIFRAFFSLYQIDANFFHIYTTKMIFLFFLIKIINLSVYKLNEFDPFDIFFCFKIIFVSYLLRNRDMKRKISEVGGKASTSAIFLIKFL